VNLEDIERIVSQSVKSKPKNLEELQRFLIGWWCRHYNKPYKNKEVLDYTFEELLFEFYEINYRQDPDKLKEAELETAAKEDIEFERQMELEYGVKILSPEEQIANEKELNKHLPKLMATAERDRNKGPPDVSEDEFFEEFDLDFNK
jgi:hypothetical protein